MVDPFLLRQANDHGVTICFADLDGADGLWVPEERTVLVSRSLSDKEIVEVIEHELAHVKIDDQHADLDAGREVLVGHPPARSRRYGAAALTAAGLLAVIGGVTFGVARTTGGPEKQEQVVAPVPSGRLTAGESPAPRTTVIPSVGPDGRIVYRTVVITETPSFPSSSARPGATIAPSPSAKVAQPAPTRTGAAPPAPGGGGPTVAPTTDPPVVRPSSPDPPPPTLPPTTAPVETSPAAGESAPVGGDPTGADAADGGGDPTGVADTSDVAVAVSGGSDAVIAP